MTTNRTHSKSITHRQHLLGFSFLMTLIFPFSVSADGTMSKDSAFLYTELAAGTISILAAQDPKGTGRYLICCVATIGAAIGYFDLTDSTPGRHHEGKKELLMAGGVVAYGMWNISMRDDDRDAVFMNNFLLINTIFLFEYFKSQQASASEMFSLSNIQFAPIKNGGTLVYQYRF